MGDDTTPTITLSPVPPSHGDTLTITYTGAAGTVLHLDWHPSGTPTTVKIGNNGKATVTVPATATSLIVSDPVGGASPVSTTIS